MSFGFLECIEASGIRKRGEVVFSFNILCSKFLEFKWVFVVKRECGVYGGV